MPALKESLKNKLSKEELELLPNSFDTIGEIAVFTNFPKKLIKKEKIIAETLLKLHKNIKTVAKKSKNFSGKYRLQKIKIILGKKTKETSHNENNITLKLDIEKCYFSPRTASERLRIASQINPGESVLVMFSGIAAFPLTISKHSNAKEIYAVEINPEAHKYAIENISINKSRNITLIKGDVNKVLKNFYQHILGLKGSINQIPSRLKLNPNLFEFHLFPEDLIKNKKSLISSIKKLKSKQITPFIHMPFLYKDKQINLSEENSQGLSIILELAKLCKENNCFAIIHPSFDGNNSKEAMMKNLSYLKPYFSWIYFENSSTKSLFAKQEDVLETAKILGMKNLAIDVSHIYKLYKSQSKVIEMIQAIQKDYNTYFHICNSDGESEGEQLNKGRINMETVLPLVTKGILEIRNKNEDNPKEAVDSFNKLKNYEKKFDRIIMPLPKDADKYLDLALQHLNKQGTIHFYDFSQEKDFPKSSIDKIKKHCKNFKVLNSVKCGHYSPFTNRVCIDFQPL
ncbi:MAG TPA: hypothetical protein VJJ21_01045 [Candidatus Nanoarchaeia archaeon]|nr:hypothetical protein [Candidatus Nanoarchaeia archaeon]